MEVYYIVIFFILGTIMASFFNVVGSRRANGQSIISPRSHCTKCGHVLKPIELIPIFSFLIQRGKCRACKTKLSWIYPVHEFCTGALYALSFYKYGFSIDFVIALTFVSMLSIVFISDYESMIILDEVLAIGSILLIIEYCIRDGINDACYYILSGCIAFGIMYLLKLFGDFLFQKESMGGGDIKLLFVFGLVLGFQMSVVTIFLAALIGLPIALIVTYKKQTNIIAFGPFLIVAALMIYFTHFSWNQLVAFLIA